MGIVPWVLNSEIYPLRSRGLGGGIATVSNFVPETKGLQFEEWQPAENTAGGLLCIWDNNNFQVDFRISEKGFILLGGTWLPEMQRVIVINIYTPCDSEGKR